MHYHPQTIVECYENLAETLTHELPNLDPVSMDMLRNSLTMIVLRAYALGGEDKYAELEKQITNYRWEIDSRNGNLR
jgi:hypothetical protein